MRCVAGLFVVLLACASAPLAGAQNSLLRAYDENTPCEQVVSPQPPAACRLSVLDVTESAAGIALGDGPFAVLRDGDHLTVFARSARDEVRLCCSLQGPMARVGASRIWVSRYRIAELDRASLGFVPPAWIEEGRTFRPDEMPVWRGPLAPRAPASKQELGGKRFERTLWSQNLNETRRLFVYLPPGHDRTRTYPAIFMADGANVMAQAGLIEALIDGGAIPPLVLVGAASGQAGIVEDRSSLGVDIRAADYLPDFENAQGRFEQHLRFFSEELVSYAVREFGVSADPARRAVQGFSNGGSFALYAALRRPDVFGLSIALSPSWRRLTDTHFALPTRAHFFISAGLYEVGRQRAARGYAEALRAHGYDTLFETPATGHFRDQEELMLAQFVPLAFDHR